MMIYIFLTALSFFLLFEIIIRKNLISPSIILISSFLLAGIIMFINRTDWDLELSFKFVLYVMTAILSFIFSGIIFRVIFDRMAHNVVQPTNFTIENISRPRLLLVLASVVFSMLYLLLTIREVGFGGNLPELLQEIYLRNVDNNANNSFLLNQLLIGVTTIAKIVVFQFFLNYFVTNKKTPISYYIFPTVLFFIVVVFSTDRNIFLRYFIYCFVLWILFFVKKDQSKNVNYKIIIRSVIILTITLVLFFLLGRTKNYTSSFQRVVGIYGGSGLYNFNLFLNHFEPNNLEFGERTLLTVRNMLDSFGIIALESPIEYFKEFVSFRSSTGYIYISNIYSALRPYVEDFGYLGVIIFPFIVGTYYELLYYKVKQYNFGFAWVFYALSAYSLVYFAIEEQFFMRIHLGSLYELIWISLLYFYIKKNIVFKIK